MQKLGCVAALAVFVGTSAEAAEIDSALQEKLSLKRGPQHILVITEPGRSPEAVTRALPKSGFKVRRRFSSLNLIAGTATRDAITTMARSSDLVRIGLDPGGSGNLAETKPLAGVSGVEASGFDGAGVTVAVLDSGIDTDHSEFAGRITAQRCFCQDCCPDGSDSQSGPGAAEDDNGHGTSIAGIAVGSTGVADAAEIVAIKVLDSNNRFCCSSDPLAGLDWIISNRPEIDVVNMSLSTFANFSGDCDGATTFTTAFADAIDTLRNDGVVVVSSTDNDGLDGDMGAPACVANAISVGAVWDDDLGARTFLGCTEVTGADKPTCFSNSSATTDLYAPGAFVLAAGLGGGTSSAGGTSQAASVVSGCMTLLNEAVPGATVSELENALENTGTNVTDPSSGLDFPRINCDLGLSAVADDGPVIDRNINRAWNNPADSGEGILLDYGPSLDLLFGAWFTSTLEAVEPPGMPEGIGGPGQRWLTMLLEVNGNVASGTLQARQGGAFRSPETEVEINPTVGEITIELLACDLAQVEYTIGPAGIGGSFDIEPLEKTVNPDGFECVDNGGG